MATQKELGEQVAKLKSEMEAILAATKTDNRPLTEEERGKYDDLRDKAMAAKAEWDSLEEDRQRGKDLDDLKDWSAKPSKRLTTPTGPPVESLDASRITEKLPKSKYFDNSKEAYLSGHWLRAHVFGNRDSLGILQRDYEQLAMVSTTNSAGGILVPEVLERTIIDLKEEYGTFRRKARVWPMASDTSIIPRRLTGLTTYFVGQETATTASDVALDSVELNARTLATLTRFSRELAEDAIVSIADMIANEAAYALAVKEDQCGFLGTGASTYGHISGLITECAAATATVVTAATANTAFSTLDLADFESMVGKLPAFPGIRPEWYISKAGWAASMMRLADAAGGTTAGDIEGGRGMSFLGYPVNFVQCMNSTLTPQTSTAGLCYFGDLSLAATVGDRRGIEILSDASRYFEYRQLAIQVSERFDINVHDVGTTSVAGPMIMLSTPSS